MATYTQLYSEYASDADLRSRVAVACAIKAQTLIDLASPTANQVTWASNCLANPLQMAANSSATLAQIQAVTDSTLQTNTGAAVDKLITAGILT